MSINDFNQKIKLFYLDIKDRVYSRESGLKIKSDLYIVLLMILLGTASFGLGKLSAYEKRKTPISVYKNTNIPMGATVLESTEISKTVSSNTTQKGIVLASKSGTKYYYPECSGVSRIKEENKVWFNTIADAEATGLTLASGCSN